MKKDIYPDWYSLFYVSSSLEGVFTRELEALADEIEIVKDYLSKYPHIKVNLMDKDNKRKRTDITYKFEETKDQVNSPF